VTAPFVTIVTPFYNTAPYLRACLDSVLAQTHPAWEYVLVDNCSTDGSSEIAAEYAARDPRVRVVRNPRHLPQLENYNVAWRLVSDRAVYCKMVQADDWVYPECVARMVAVGERHPRVGLVSSYYHKGPEVWGTGLPADQECFSGREIARSQLMHGQFYLGSCTSVLYRASLVRGQEAFYDPAALHADTEAGYRILQEWDFGFVHQVLTYLRLDDASISGRVRDWNPHVLDKLIVLKRFGAAFLSPAEYAATLAAVSRRYWRDMGRRALRPRGAEFWAYHRRGLARAGERLTAGRVARGALGALVDLALHPAETLAALRQLGAR
jgi:glycosyltransferase involved in cell wall biosynthesis